MPTYTVTCTTTTTSHPGGRIVTTTKTVAVPAPAAEPVPAATPAIPDRKAYLQANYPKHVDEVTTEWLSQLLEKELTGHSVIKVLEAGVTSDAAIFGLQYAAGSDGPASICLKYAKATESNRVFAMGGDMYKKEIFFFQDMYHEVEKVMSIPKLVGVFVDDEKPEEFFCIAMEDLNARHTPIDQIAGITFDECVQLAKMAAAFHAAFWGHPLLKEDVVCKGNPEACAIFFEQWGRLGCTTEGAWEAYVEAAAKPPVSFDMQPTDRDKKAIRLMRTYTNELFEQFHKVLDSRPKTLTHGDMRGDNMFKKNDGTGFTVIDWQTFGAASPGVEMHQLFANQIDDLAEYKRLPELMKAYLDELHKVCPLSKDYSYDMLWEDFRICGAIGSMCMCIALGPILIELQTPEPPYHPNVLLFAKFMPRCRTTYDVLDIASIVIDTAAQLGLKDPEA